MRTPFVITGLETISADKLVANIWNANEMTPQIFERLRKEIREQGFDTPIMVRIHAEQKGFYEIIDGEHRWKAGVKEGMTSFPCVLVEATDKEVMFRTYVRNNLRGEINEVKLAILIQNFKEKGVSTSLIYNRTGIRAHKQEALLEKLRPDNVSREVMAKGASGQHRSFAVILSLGENEVLHRAIKLTRLHKDVDSLMEIVDYWMDKHQLTLEQQEKLEKLKEDVENVEDAQGLVDLCSFYLSNVQKNEIRRD